MGPTRTPELRAARAPSADCSLNHPNGRHTVHTPPGQPAARHLFRHLRQQLSWRSSLVLLILEQLGVPGPVPAAGRCWSGRSCCSTAHRRGCPDSRNRSEFFAGGRRVPAVYVGSGAGLLGDRRRPGWWRSRGLFFINGFDAWCLAIGVLGGLRRHGADDRALPAQVRCLSRCRAISAGDSTAARCGSSRRRCSRCRCCCVIVAELRMGALRCGLADRAARSPHDCSCWPASSC